MARYLLQVASLLIILSLGVGWGMKVAEENMQQTYGLVGAPRWVGWPTLSESSVSVAPVVADISSDSPSSARTTVPSDAGNLSNSVPTLAANWSNWVGGRLREGVRAFLSLVPAFFRWLLA